MEATYTPISAKWPEKVCHGCKTAGRPLYLHVLKPKKATPFSTTSGQFPVFLMRFVLIDRIIDFQPGVRITAVKSLTMAEEYLADHFPNFPVMPGVLMLEAMTQASAWLIRLSEDFAHSVIVLKQANNVKYGQFVEPGQQLTVTVEIISQTDTETKVKAEGKVDGRTTVSGRLILERYNLIDRCPLEATADEAILKEMRGLLSVLYQPGPPVVPSMA